MRVWTRSPMPGATFWVLAISALALIAFVSGPVAEEYPLAVFGNDALELGPRQLCEPLRRHT